MGLPLFVTPVEPEEAAKTTDKIAARSRSSIRRQRAVRRPNVYGMTDYFGASAPIEETDPDEIRERDAVRRRMREVTGPPRESSIGSGSAPPARREDRHGLQSPLGLNAEGLPPPPMPPVPESRDFQGSRRSGYFARRGRNGRSWSGRQGDQFRQSTGSYPSLTRRETSTDLANPRPGAHLPALTPNFSPARRYRLEESGDQYRGNSPPRYSPYPAYPYTDELLLPRLSRLRSPSRDSRSHLVLPPLRQMGRRSISDFASRRRLRAAHLDGLGDRDRSLSPDGDGAWDTMLTTLTPDPQLPSAGSSFASASGATSDSSNAETSGTSLTTMGSNSTSNSSGPVDAAIDCDLIQYTPDSSEMSNTEGEDEEDVYDLEHALSSRDRFWNLFGDVPLAEGAARHRGDVEMDSLAGWQRVVSRLARRGDIPDEWWAQVGFIRSIPREADRIRT